MSANRTSQHRSARRGYDALAVASEMRAAQVRLRAGKPISSPALIADGNHARVDGFVSLGVVASVIVVALGAPIADPIIGLLITVVIPKVTPDSWRTVSTTETGALDELRER